MNNIKDTINEQVCQEGSDVSRLSVITLFRVLCEIPISRSVEGITCNSGYLVVMGNAEKFRIRSGFK